MKEVSRMENENKNEQKNKKGIKIVIIILAVLLGLSLAALVGTIVHNMLTQSKQAVVTVPDNLISPDDNGKTSSNFVTSGGGSDSNMGGGDSAGTASGSGSKAKTAAAIELYKKKPGDNTAFDVENMFPGDKVTEYFRVRVSYHDKITVHYHADIRPGYEKLSEVLKVKVQLLSTGKTLYNGLMRDMPKSLDCKLSSQNSTTDELYYKITAYLDTSVGNDYQNKNLIADFRWWVEQTGNLEPIPTTGDEFYIQLWALLAAVSGIACLVLVIFRRRKEGEEK